MLPFRPKLRGRFSRSCCVLSVQRGLHGYDRRSDNCVAHDHDKHYAYTWSNDDDHRYLQSCYDRSVRWRIDGAEHVLPVYLHTDLLRECCYLLIILDLLPVSVGFVLCVTGRHERGDGVWNRGWDYCHGDVCTGGGDRGEYM